MAEKQQQDEWVYVVDGEGNPIPENPRVPRSWLGTNLLPEGAKEADPPEPKPGTPEAALAERERALAEREALLTEREAALAAAEGGDAKTETEGGTVKPATAPKAPAKTAATK